MNPKSNRRHRMSRSARSKATRGACPTGKRRFRDKAEAGQALWAAASAHAGEHRREKRSYWCGACQGWHLTSVAIEFGTLIDPVQVHSAAMSRESVARAA